MDYFSRVLKLVSYMIDCRYYFFCKLLKFIYFCFVNDFMIFYKGIYNVINRFMEEFDNFL